ncbi:hypothetical protein CJD36_020960 [Flavipsychrobacter stenotrophus]|uniref:Smr domain-containing protein n=1 Tax=Flavipsychrobacter stenotrophus TaxID=2077091 RepID=A0A2S7SQ70_9BACT|nr:Smr/MutS family protein [Flavipsychrobacter stenotrophus]PQJ09049.1 hypothetical protein CJD36_020960 [Flavipsychrobacter stenotrophus]
MKFTIGDKILLKRTGEEGHVVALIDKQMMEVEVNGTAFPVYIEDVDHPYLKWFTEKKPQKKSSALPEIPVERIIERKPKLATGIYLSFVPVFRTEDMEEVVDYIKVYLLNELPVDIKFSYDVQLANKSIFKHEGSLHSFGNIYLNNVTYSDMNDQPRFTWKVRDIGNEKMEMAEGIVRIRPTKLFEHINNVMLNSEPSFSYQMIQEFMPKKKPEPQMKLEQKEPETPGIVNKRTLEPAKYEIDLHIEQLVKNVAALSNDEIIKKQLDTLEKYVHLAIAHHQQTMIVIHGMGKGKLREEVHAILKKTPEVKRFKNEWSGKYGFGATEVTFRY